MREFLREFTPEIKAHVENLVEYKCMVCNRPLTHGAHHHDIQMKEGGTGEMWNDVYVCPRTENICHVLLDSLSEKGVRFRDIRGFNVGLSLPPAPVTEEI